MTVMEFGLINKYWSSWHIIFIKSGWCWFCCLKPTKPFKLLWVILFLFTQRTKKNKLQKILTVRFDYVACFNFCVPRRPLEFMGFIFPFCYIHISVQCHSRQSGNSTTFLHRNTGNHIPSSTFIQLLD